LSNNKGEFLGAFSIAKCRLNAVERDQPIIIQLRLGVMGDGGNIRDRFKDVRLFFRLVGESNYQTLEASKAISEE
jgi:hypothetical protein